MKQSNELILLSETFKKCRLAVRTVPRRQETQSFRGEMLERAVSGELPLDIISAATEDKTLYRYKDSFGLCYKYVQFGDDILCVGPYLSSPVSEKFIFEISEINGVTPKKQKYLTEFYAGIPVLDEFSPLFVLLDTFLERLWDSPSFAIVDRGSDGAPPSPINRVLREEDSYDVLVNMKAMEQRYNFENELCEAVALGQLHKEGQLLSAFSAETFEKRVADQMRNAKNYGIIMNTLLRKAAERGGVHPVYLDRISSDFALKIEKISSLADNRELMLEMFRTYCRLVRKHSMKHYSPLVQKTVLIIDSDLAQNLSLSTLADVEGVSPGYLSTVFKRETGKTLSAYVTEKRMKYAAHLLSTTNLQIQTIALHCGILDLQYFSKLFKRHTGKSPKEYRENEKHMDVEKKASPLHKK